MICKHGNIEECPHCEEERADPMPRIWAAFREAQAEDDLLDWDDLSPEEKIEFRGQAMAGLSARLDRLSPISDEERNDLDQLAGLVMANQDSVGFDGVVRGALGAAFHAGRRSANAASSSQKAQSCTAPRTEALGE